MPNFFASNVNRIQTKSKPSNKLTPEKDIYEYSNTELNITLKLTFNLHWNLIKLIKEMKLILVVYPSSNYFLKHQQKRRNIKA